MRLYIIRHADPDYPNDTITGPGHLEAKALAQRLKREGIERIYSSPVPRALHTMEYTAKLMNLEPVIEPWMAELGGWHVDGADGQLKAAWNVDGEIVRESEPFPQRNNWCESGPFVNQDFAARYDQLKANSDHFLASLGYVRDGGRYRIEQPNQQKIAIFCHLGFGLTWLSHLLEIPVPSMWVGFWKAPSSVTTILMDERTDQWAVPRCLGLGDTSHLFGSELPTSSQGIMANFD
ncbi:histidine phosphatase family protein [Paenibacillus mendelii]|uniref:Histidine phosphatase family protein n=1 Tax=Paenibacillus mendelii TaxID=206163 RepID=A0ABV6JII6_9BACL|nr:histidine phosphatase family protein [Paenibacillus mendelii]MCQ6557534.1 histidine phosphatase family protein [Paenibacillus mendelii]